MTCFKTSLLALAGYAILSVAAIPWRPSSGYCYAADSLCGTPVPLDPFGHGVGTNYNPSVGTCYRFRGILGVACNQLDLLNFCLEWGGDGTNLNRGARQRC